MKTRVPCGCIVIAGFVSLCFGVPTIASAEWYIAGYGGLAVPENLGNAQITQRFQRFGAVSEARVVDLDLVNSLAIGGKLGYYSQERKWLGVEADLYTSTPFMKQQIAIVGSPRSNPTLPTTFAAVVPGAHIRVNTLAINVLTRDKSTEHFQPYGGVGPAFFYVTSRDFPGEGEISMGLSLIGGGRYFFTERFALFGEFKYNLAPIKFGGVSGNYTTQMFIGGFVFNLEQ